jgi:hypothetical protein
MIEAMKKLLIIFCVLASFGAIAQPTLWGGAKLKVEQGDTAFVTSLGAIKNWLGLSGGGTVSSFSSGNLSPLFTTSVANATTTPALSYTLSNAGANTYFGNATGSSGAPSYTSAGALTKTDDTNVTLTLGGNPTTSLLRAVSITVGWSGILAPSRGGTNNGFTAFTGPTTSTKTFTLPNASATILTTNAAVTAAQGGTGQSSYTVGDILYASTSSALSKLADVATGNSLISGGVGVAPSWGKIGLTTHVSGTLPVANGGTGATTLTGILQGNGTSAVTVITNSSTVGQVLRVTGASTYAWGALDLADGDAITNGLPVANGGTGLSSVGGDVTLLGSNGSTNGYFALAITTTSASIGFARSGSTLNLNIPDADASFRGTVSTGTQTFAGAKTFSGAVTVSGLATASAGMEGVATSSQAGVYSDGVGGSKVTTLTSTTTLDHTYNYVEIGTLSANITINLPACNSTRSGWEYEFLKAGSDAFAFILDPNSTETFHDSATTKTLYSQGNNATCKCNGSGVWYYRSK